MINDNNGKIGIDAIKARMQDSVFLTKEEYTAIRTAAIETPVQDNVMINAFPAVNGANPFATYHQYTKLDRYGTATESAIPGDAEAIEVDGTLVRVEVPFYHADFVINKFVSETMQGLGSSLDTLKVRAATRKVNDLFDTAIYSKSSVFGSLGAVNLFTGTAAAAAVWSTATNTAAAAKFNDVVNFKKGIPAAYQSENCRLVLEAVNYGELAMVNDYGLSAATLLKAAFPQLQILVSGQVSHGAGLFYPFRDDAAYVFQGMPLQVLEWEVKPFEAKYKVVRSGRLIVPAPTAGLVLSGL